MIRHVDIVQIDKKNFNTSKKVPFKVKFKTVKAPFKSRLKSVLKARIVIVKVPFNSKLNRCP